MARIALNVLKSDAAAQHANQDVSPEILEQPEARRNYSNEVILLTALTELAHEAKGPVEVKLRNRTCAGVLASTSLE